MSTVSLLSLQINMDSPHRTIRVSVIPIVIAAGGVLLMSSTAQLLIRGTIPLLPISLYETANITVSMQLIVLPFSFLALGILYMYRKEGFKAFFHFGLSSSKNRDWNSYGPFVALLFTFGTTVLMAFSVMSQHGRVNETFFRLLPFVILVSATNAWSEEIFSRFVIVAGLHEKLNPNTICSISAVIFGAPHFFGTPSGLFGVITSGLLGWILAKSVIETEGMGWALLIHFLQDGSIFGACAMIIA
jgi:membrane protease YdiL (CAAX protease family)